LIEINARERQTVSNFHLSLDGPWGAPREADMVANTAGKSGRDASGSEHQICDPPHACRACLAASGLAVELTDDQIDALFKVINIRRLAKGDVLVSEGEYDDRLYAIARGEFDVSRHESADRDIQLARLHRGTITGELAFLDGLKRTASVRAATDGACAIALKRQDLESLVEVDPDLALRLMFAVIRSANRTVDRMNTAHLDMMRYIQG
jgi:CRP-like cAMP-binding protein